MTNDIEPEVERFDPKKHIAPGRTVESYVHSQECTYGYEVATHVVYFRREDLVFTNEEGIYTFVRKMVALSREKGFRMKERWCMSEEEWENSSLRWMLVMYDQPPYNRGVKALSALWLAQTCFGNSSLATPGENEMLQGIFQS